MPEKTAIKVNNYAVMPVSLVLSLATLSLLALKLTGVLTIPWLVVFSPILIWLGIVIAAGLVIVAIISLVALVQIWR